MLIIGLIPGIAWLVYFLVKGPIGGGSFDNVARVFVAGLFCTIPANLVEDLTGAQLKPDTVLGSIITSFCLIAPIEEFFKLAAVWISIYRRPEFRTPADGMIFAMTAGLGFASIENALYLVRYGQEIWYFRLLYATPAHVMFSAMWGYSMGVARFNSSGEIASVAKGFLQSVGFHGTYNFLVAHSFGYARFTLAVLLVLMAWFTWNQIKKLRNAYPYPPMDAGPVIVCPNCSAYTPECEPFCRRCGATVKEIDYDSQRYCGHCRAPLRFRGTHCGVCGATVESCEFQKLADPSTVQS